MFATDSIAKQFAFKKFMRGCINAFSKSDMNVSTWPLLSKILAQSFVTVVNWVSQSEKISNDQELIQSDPTSCPQNQKGNN